MGDKKSILIVDDDVAMSQMTKLVLEKTGLYTVTVCNCGKEAMRLIREMRPGLVLLDIVMPDADGTEIAAQVCRDKSLGGTRIVFMTSLISQQEALESFTIGGHPFIAKPIGGETLLQRIQGLFEVGH